MTGEQDEGPWLPGVVDELCRVIRPPARLGRRIPCAGPLPSRSAVIELYGELRRVLLPGHHEVAEVTVESLPYHLGATLDSVARRLQEQVWRAFCFACRRDERLEDCVTRAREMTRRFLERLPGLRRLLLADVEAAYAGDPACTSPDEAILCYPGIEAMTCYRLAHALHELGVPLLPRILTEFAHGITGIDIHPGATIGKRFFIDHGTGVVVGETCIIGDSVRLYQGVTLGARSFPLDENGRPIKGIPRHPIIEDDVTVYAGATILGRVTIGKGSVIGGNVWLTRSVPPRSRVMQARSSEEVYQAGAGI